MNFYQYFHYRRVEVLREMLNGRKFTNALDVGVGEGMLRSLGIQGVVGIDIRRDGAGVVIRASTEDLPFTGGAFDLLFAGEVLEHLDHPGKALREWVRVLRSKGTIVISTPNGRFVSTVGGNPEHKAIYAPNDIIQSLEKLGLKMVSSKGIFTGLVSGTKLFRLVPFAWMKTLCLRVRVPLSISYDAFFMASKQFDLVRGQNSPPRPKCTLEKHFDQR